MADVTIGQLPPLAAAPTDEFEIQQTGSGASGKVTLQQIVDEVLDQNPPTAWGQIIGVIGNQTDLQNALDGKAASGAEDTAVWGQITGILSSQTDLQSALDAKLSVAGGTITGDLTVQGAFTSVGIDDNATATAITILANRNIGVGNANPFYNFDVRGVSPGMRVLSDSGTASMYIQTLADGDARYLVMGAATGPQDERIAVVNHAWTLRNNAVDAFRIDGNNNFIGIVPTASLFWGSAGVGQGNGPGIYVRPQTGNAQLTMQVLDSTSQSNLFFGDVNNSFAGIIRYAHVSDSMALFTNAVEAMRIDSSQNTTIRGDLIVDSLAGAGTRDVQVLPDGTLIAV